MKIRLKNITLINFKGAKRQIIELNKETSIFGDNATGKSTIFDGFSWLLFGKDSFDRSDFDVKFKDKQGNTVDNQDVEVSATITIDGVDREFKRVLREQWGVTKKGCADTEFKGNETHYFIDDLPLKSSEFQQRMNDLIDDKLFKLITSPTAFNSLPWKDRRSLLMLIVGEVSSDTAIEGLDVSADKKQELINMLAKDSSLENHKKTIASKIKTQKDELKLIPTRINEALRSKPEEVDFSQIEKELELSQSEIEAINGIIANESKAVDSTVKELSELKKRLYKVNSEIERKENECNKEAIKLTTIDDSERELLEIEIERLEGNQSSVPAQIERLANHVKDLRLKFSEVNSKSFEMDSNLCACPTCKREFESDDIESKRIELEENFNTAKASRLAKIRAEGGLVNKEIEAYIELDTEANRQITAAKTKLEALPKAGEVESFKIVHDRLISELKNSSLEYDLSEELTKEILEKEESIGKVDPELLHKKDAAQVQVDELKIQLAANIKIEEVNLRVNELEAEEKSIAQEIANLERTDFLIKMLNKSMVDLLEYKVNSLFTLVKFKMFETQINGGESEVCICTVDGVNYNSLNTAMKINAGLEIINVFNDFYKISAPIFIDGRESVVELIDTNTQVINLVVSKADKKLRVV